MTATALLKNQVSFAYLGSADGGLFGVIEAPGGWADVKKLPRLVKLEDGTYMKWTGWDSDKNVAYYRETNAIIGTKV